MSTFGGFTQKQMELIARDMGFDGPMNKFNEFLSDFAKEFSIDIYFDYDSGDIEYTLTEYQLLLFELISEDLFERFNF